MQTQVAIIRAAPSGMSLAHLLLPPGIDAMVTAPRDHSRVKEPVRAAGSVHGSAMSSPDGRIFHTDMMKLTGSTVAVDARQEGMRPRGLSFEKTMAPRFRPADLDCRRGSLAAQRALAENHAGLPLEAA